MNRRMILWGVAALSVALSGCGSAPLAQPSEEAEEVSGIAFGSQAQDSAPKSVIIKFRRGTAAEKRAALHRAKGRKVDRTIPQLDIHVVPVPPGESVDDVIASYRSDPLVEFGEPDHVYPPALVPDDPWYNHQYVPQWHLPHIGGPAAWDTTTGDTSLIIAIIDSGANRGHEDLASKMVPGWNIVDNNPDTSDINGHGTLVAGTAGAASNNGIGIASVAWGCRLMPIRVANSGGTASGSDIAAGLVWAADNGARIANLSFEMADSPTVTSAAQYFESHGGVVVQAAGNSGLIDPTPDNPHLLKVSATDQNDLVPSWSVTGDSIDLAAPGVGIITTNRSGGYSSATGTSNSAPVVAGLAALVLSANPDLTGQDVQDILKQSADDFGPAGWDPEYGWGRVNAAAAVSLAVNYGGTPDVTPPSVTVVDPAEGDVVSGMITIVVEASDNVGVTQVDLYVDGSFVSSDTVPPHEWAFDTTTLADGAHTISAVAYDAAGNSAESDLVHVIVDNTTPAPECLSNSDCDDTVFCNGAETCDANGICQPGTDPCPGQLCRESDDTCVDCLSNSECDDGLFCTGAETCDASGLCQPGSDPCPGEDCDEVTEVCVPTVCDNDGTCEPDEDCEDCPGDCPSGSGASCGNGVCDAADGEDCLSCPQDCNGNQVGKPSGRFCCGDGDGVNPVGCEDERCTSGGSTCSAVPGMPWCCGDGACEGGEDGFNCEADCGPPPFCGDGACNTDENSCNCPDDCGAPPASEAECANGLDEDCDGDTDCDDADCADNPVCACLPTGASCTANAECCSNKCLGNGCK